YGLREELVRQRHVLVVHEVDAREVGDVRHAVGRRRRDHRRDDALEARGDLRQRDGGRVLHGHASTRASRAPADGPGVWSNSSSILTTHATTSSGSARRTISGGTPSIALTAATIPSQNASKR